MQPFTLGIGLKIVAVILAFSSDTVFHVAEGSSYQLRILSSSVDGHGHPEIRGVVEDHGREVNLTTPLYAVNDDGQSPHVCRFSVHERRNKSREAEVPFEVVLTDWNTGQGAIRVKEGRSVDSRTRQHYRFYIEAEDCSSPPVRSDRAVVIIDVGERHVVRPRFENTSYTINVEEGKIFFNLLHLRLVAGDDQTGVVGFRILTPDVPFYVNFEGVLLNTEALDRRLHRNYILQVAAVGEDGHPLDQTFVNVVVKAHCQVGWRGVPAEVAYVAGQGGKVLADDPRLHLCRQCDAEELKVTVVMATKDMGKGCERDQYSMTARRKLCGAGGDSVDLLPSPWSAEWTKNVPMHDSQAMDQVFSFDGLGNAVEVPSSHVDHHLKDRFTISVWMKRDPSLAHTPPHLAPKEQILCMSDGEGMSRRHYAWWVHGEKMVLLVRVENTSREEMDEFMPAEFRWHVPRINDNLWHHYTVTMDTVNDVWLYMDGNRLLTDRTNYEELVDWPLHSTGHVHSTRLVVGACWLGREQRFKDYFHGYLSGMVLVNGRVESTPVIKCLYDCSESLGFWGLAEMTPGTVISFNSDKTQFTAFGRTVAELEELLRGVTYVNARTFPTPGHRNITVDTVVRCPGGGVSVPQVGISVMVQHQTPKATIVINGASNLTSLRSEFLHGLRILHDVNIVFRGIPAAAAGRPDRSWDEDSKGPLQDKLLIDRCEIAADPVLDLFVEHLFLPTELINHQNLEWSETNDGLVISNADTVDSYRSVIRDIRYYHNDPRKLSNRTFTLTCSSMERRFVSNRFIVRMVALQPERAAHRHAYAQEDPIYVHQQVVAAPSGQAVRAAIATTSNVGIAAIVVVCVGFLLFMIVLGVVRIRAAHRRTEVVHVDEKLEMEWDSSGLNITVNPVEREIFDYEESGRARYRGNSDSDDDDEGGSMLGDNVESSEDDSRCPGKKRWNDLEWDSSHLGI